MSSILHQCPFCQQITDVSTSLAAFIESPHCSQCGLSVSESSLKMQDELSTLFAKHMNVGPPTSTRSEETFSAAWPFPQAPSISYSITQHYHHSSHVALQVGKRETEEIGPRSNAIPDQAICDILNGYGINLLSLSPDQISLFQNAGQEQRSRLVQMWQICAESRERNGGDAALGKQKTHCCVGSVVQQQSYESPTEDLEMTDPACSRESDDEQQYAEPYMLSGYEALAQRNYDISPRQTATSRSASQSAIQTLPNEPTTGSPYSLASDPVYHQSQRWWELTETGPMEHQYGEYERRSQYAGCGVVAAHCLR